MIASKGMGGTASVGSPEAGIAQVAQLHREADPVAIAAPLANRLPIWLGECAVPDQLFFGIWKCQQTFPLGGGQDRTTGHWRSSYKRWFMRSPKPMPGRDTESMTSASHK